MEPAATGLFLAATGVLLLLAGLASPASQRLGVPALLLFLLLGMVAGSEGIGGIPFDDYAVAFRLGTVALVLILFDGGLNTSPALLRSVAPEAGVLATLGVVLTAGLVAGAAVLLGFPLTLAVLIGAVVSSTDAAAVFSVLRSGGIRLTGRTAALLEVESGINDPMAVILTVLATEIVLGEQTLGWGTLVFCARQFGLGALGGLAFGWLGRLLLRIAALPAAGLYPVLTVAIAFASFGVTTLLDGSGFVAVYLAAIVVGAGTLPYRASVRRVHDGLAWLAQLSMFLLLGLLVFPSKLWPLTGAGLLLALLLAVVARPLAVLLSLLPFRVPLAERLFVAWVGLRGAVPVVLATYPVLRGVPGGDEIFHLVFFVVLASSLIPGATVAPLAGRLGLAAPQTPSPPADIELVSRREYRGDFVWFFVARASAVAGAYVRELPLPEECVLALLLRGDTIVPPRGDTQLQIGDHVCVFVTPEHRALLDLLFGQEADTT